MTKQVKKIPGFGRWLLKNMMKPGDYEYALGDISEIFIKLTEEKNMFRAGCWFWFHVISSMPRFIKNKVVWSMIMLRHYIKISLRSIKRHKGYSFINIAGLAVGMACCILAFLWVQNELSYDRFHKNNNELFRIISVEHLEDQITHVAKTPNPLGPSLKNEYPEIVAFTRYSGSYSGWFLRYGDKFFDKEVISHADPNFFEVFRFSFIKGDPKTALKDRYSVVITEKIAKKYFGEEEPLGKAIQSSVNNDFIVTAVIEDIPNNCHMKFDLMFPLINMTVWENADFESWGRYGFHTYIQLRKSALSEDVNQKISGTVRQHFQESKIAGIYLQSLRKIHLYSSFKFDIEGNGNITYVYIFSLTAICILLIACINFMNLSTARSAIRAKEIGMRKVAGARRKDIITQFLGESILSSFIALFIALIIAFLLLAVFNNLTGKQLSINLYGNLQLLFGLIIITLLTAFIAGSYPALYLSSYHPVRVLKGLSSISHSSFRKILVVIQFTITGILIISTVVIYNQLLFIKNRPMGFNEKNLVFIPNQGDFRSNYESVKNEFLQNPDILNISTAMPPVGRTPGITDIVLEGENMKKDIYVNRYSVDHEYLETFGMEMAEGRFFSSLLGEATNSSSFILNETAVKTLGIDSPVGKRISFKEVMTGETKEGIIIGVIKDFMQYTFHDKIQPLILCYGKRNFFINVRFRPGSISRIVDFLEAKWKEYMPNYSVSYHFLDESIENRYNTERRLSRIIKYFTYLCVIISCLGLFGLASFMAERRTKEVGIRKVLGASITKMVLLLSKEFMKWVFYANIIALPVAYFMMNRWLQNFAYRINIGVGIFLLSIGLSLVIAVITIAYQALKAASANPVNSLRYE